MKIRSGFISNSSTTSFVIVGLNIDSWNIESRASFIRELKSEVQPEGKPVWELYDSYWGGEVDLGDGLLGYGWDGDIEYIGIQAMENWKNGMSFKQSAKACKKLIREKYGIDVPVDKFDVFYGEAGNG